MVRVTYAFCGPVKSDISRRRSLSFVPGQYHPNAFLGNPKCTWDIEIGLAIRVRLCFAKLPTGQLLYKKVKCMYFLVVHINNMKSERDLSNNV